VIALRRARADDVDWLVELLTHEDTPGFNERAIRHSERAGFIREGVERKAYLRHGEWQDAVLFALVREDLDA
jgi:hypothetical protein